MEIEDHDEQGFASPTEDEAQPLGEEPMLPSQSVPLYLPSDQALIDKVNKEHPFIDTFKESGIYVLPCTVKQLFSIFFEDDAPAPFTDFWISTKSNTNQKLTKWIDGNTILPPDADIKNCFKFDQ